MIPANKTELLRNGVNVIGCFQGQFGLAETARLFVSALEKHSIPHSLISSDFLVPNNLRMKTSSFTFEEKGKYPINLFCTNDEAIPVFVRHMGLKYVKHHYNISTCFWETNVFPTKRAADMKLLDEVWVTSHYIHEILTSKIKVPIYHIPQPLQLDYIQEHPDKAAFDLDNKFTFLFCFDFYSIFERKNPLAIVRAFQKAFPAQDHVQLVIKSHNGHLGHLHAKQLNAALEYTKLDPRIKWLDISLDQKKRYDLMNMCDCYVSLHRSEGFGLTMAEAMLLEKPVIATGYSGNLDFMTRDNSFLCGYKLVPVGPNNDPYSPEGIWADVDIDEAAFWMDYVVKNPAEAKKKAMQGKKDILRTNSPVAVGKVINERIDSISSKLTQKRMPRLSKLYLYHLMILILRSPRVLARPLKRLYKRIIHKWKGQHD